MWRTWVAKTPGLSRHPVVDIVAIQGLGANPDRTWVGRPLKSPSASPLHLNLSFLWGAIGRGTMLPRPLEVESTDNEVVWLRDFLPHYIADARIISYAYASRKLSWGNDARETLREYGTQFIERLALKRQADGSESRPLILIGHSMGGLVLKQGLVIADHGPRFTSIKNSLKGLIFLGVPHHGSDVAVWGAWLARALQGNTALLNSLRPKAPELYSLSRDFEESYQHVETHCFLEKRDHPYLGPIVTNESASLPHRSSIVLDTTHQDLNKFCNEEDPNFEPIREALVRLVQGITRTMSFEAPSSNATPVRTSAVAPRNVLFTGRDETLERIETGFISSNRLALVGLSGIGKTQIALEFVHGHLTRNSGFSILWANSSSSTSFRQSLESIAQRLAIPGSADPAADVPRLVSAWLANPANGSWIMVLDDLHAGIRMSLKPMDLERNLTTETWTIFDFLPHVMHGRVLVTCLNRSLAHDVVGRSSAIVQVNALSPSAAKALFQSLLSEPLRHNNAQIAELAEELDCIPMAITQAAAYLEKKAQVTISDYIGRLRSSATRQALLVISHPDLWRDASGSNAVVTTWAVSYRQLLDESPAAIEMLGKISLVFHENIPTEILAWPEVYSAADREALSLLETYSLIRIDPNTRAISTHRLVQIAVQLWQPSEDARRHTFAVLSALVDLFPTNIPSNIETCEQLSIHGISLIHNIHEEDISTKDAVTLAALAETIAAFAEHIGDYDISYDIAAKSQSIRERVPEAGPPEAFAGLDLMLRACTALARYTEGEKIGRRLVEWSMERDSKAETAYRRGNFAILLQHMDRFSEALDIMIPTAERTSDSGVSEVEVLMKINAAFICLRLDHLNEAEQLLRDVYNYSTRLQNPPVLIKIQQLRGLLSLKQGKYEEAQESLQTALGSCERLYGSDHPITLEARILNLGHHHDINVWRDPPDTNEELLKILQRRLGSSHPSTLIVQFRLGSAYRIHCNLDSAILHHRDALDKARKILGDKHTCTLSIEIQCALTLLDMQRTDEALEILATSPVRSETLLGVDHPVTIGIRATIARIYQHQEQLQRSETMFDRIIGQLARLDISVSLQLFEIYVPASWLFVRLGNHEKAERTLTYAINKFEAYVSSSHPGILELYQTLANLYQSQGRYQDAFPIHKKVLASMESQLGRIHPQTVSALMSVAMTSASLGLHVPSASVVRLAFDELMDQRGFGATSLSVVIEKNIIQLEVEAGMGTEIVLSRLRQLEERAALYFGSDSQIVLEIRSSYGSSLSEAGQVEIAIELLSSVLDAQAKSISENHSDTQDTMDNLAICYERLKSYETATEFRKKVLCLKRDLYGPKSFAAIAAADRLARNYQLREQFQEAVKWRDWALVQNPEIVPRKFLHNMRQGLSISYISLKQHEKAIPILQRELKELNADTALHQMSEASAKELQRSCQSILALALGQCNEPAQALELLDEIIPWDAPKTSWTDHDLNLLYRCSYHCLQVRQYDRAADAIELYMEAHRTRTRIDDVELLKGWTVLALIRSSEKRYDAACDILLQAIPDHERTYGLFHENTYAVYKSLAAAYFKNADFENCAAVERLLLQRHESEYGHNDDRTLERKIDLGFTLTKLQQYNDAAQLERYVYNQRLDRLGPEDLQTMGAMGNLAFSLMNLGQLAEAEDLAKRTLSGREAKLGKVHPYTLRAKSVLGCVHEKQGRLEDAIALHQQALDESLKQAGTEDDGTKLFKQRRDDTIALLPVELRAQYGQRSSRCRPM